MRPATPVLGFLLDLALIAAVTVLAAVHEIPGTVALSWLGLIAGAKIYRAAKDGTGGDGGGTTGPTQLPPGRPEGGADAPRSLRLADVSLAVALGAGLLALLVPSHGGRA
jgi:hypothetical protein